MAQLLELIQKKTFAFTFAGIAILYLFLFVTLLPHDSIWISDEGNRIAAVRAYAETSQRYLPDPFSGLEQVPGQGLAFGILGVLPLDLFFSLQGGRTSGAGPASGDCGAAQHSLCGADCEDSGTE